MAVTLAVLNKWDDGQRVHIVYSAVFSGNYPTGGELISSWPGAPRGTYRPICAQVQGLNVPLYLTDLRFTTNPTVFSNVEQGVMGLFVIKSDTGAELAAGAYPGAMSKTGLIHAVFPKF